MKRFQKISKIAISTAVLVVTATLPIDMSANDEKPSEYLVKATFLYNFANFVEWPPEAFAGPDAPVVVCILGQDPFGDALVAIADKKAGDRPLVVRLCDNMEDIGKCQILFVSPSEKSRLSEIFSRLREKACLTVSDLDGFAGSGGMIGFFIVENKVRFEINLSAVRPSGLKISSRLLKLARITESEKTIEKDTP